MSVAKRPLHCGISSPSMSAMAHKQNIAVHSGHVRFAPESGHRSASSACPLSAKSGLNAVQQETIIFDSFIFCERCPTCSWTTSLALA